MKYTTTVGRRVTSWYQDKLYGLSAHSKMSNN